MQEITNVEASEATVETGAPSELNTTQEIPEAAQYVETGEHQNNLSDKTTMSAEEEHLWYLQEGILGKGGVPPYFKKEKFKTMADQAKAYIDAEKKLGAFTGAPESYEVPSFEGKVELNSDDPAMNKFMETAKELNMSQEAFEKLTGLYVENIQSTLPNLEDEYQKLGENADKKIEVVSDWAKTVLAPEEYEKFESSLVSADMVNMLLKLKGSNIEPSIPGASSVQAQPAISRAKISELMSDPRYMEDKNYRNEVRTLIEKYSNQR